MKKISRFFFIAIAMIGMVVPICSRATIPSIHGESSSKGIESGREPSAKTKTQAKIRAAEDVAVDEAKADSVNAASTRAAHTTAQEKKENIFVVDKVARGSSRRFVRREERRVQMLRIDLAKHGVSPQNATRFQTRLNEIIQRDADQIQITLDKVSQLAVKNATDTPKQKAALVLVTMRKWARSRAREFTRTAEREVQIVIATIRTVEIATGSMAEAERLRDVRRFQAHADRVIERIANDFQRTVDQNARERAASIMRQGT